MSKAKLCPGYFSNEVIDILRKDNGIAYLSQPCANCGRKVTAENKAGKWVPRSHFLPAKQSRRALKLGGYKRLR